MSSLAYSARLWLDTHLPLSVTGASCGKELNGRHHFHTEPHVKLHMNPIFTRYVSECGCNAGESMLAIMLDYNTVSGGLFTHSERHHRVPSTNYHHRTIVRQFQGGGGKQPTMTLKARLPMRL